MTFDWRHTPTGRAIKKEAHERQGTAIQCRVDGVTRELKVRGTSSTIAYQFGSEGLVHWVEDSANRATWRLKCFGQPSDQRMMRCQKLIELRLSNPSKAYGDSLGGAPVSFVDSLAGETKFGILMKDVKGRSWKEWKDTFAGDAESGQLPDLRTRITWCYGLANAVNRLEDRGVIHADLSEGNLVLQGFSAPKGDMAVIDFDAFACPNIGISLSAMKGSPGYAAPEIASRKELSIGSDRTGLAVLIQEMLLIGHPGVDVIELKDSPYSQEEDLNERKGRAKEPFRKHFKHLAALLDQTLQATTPQKRTDPARWMAELKQLYQQQFGGQATSGAKRTKDPVTNVVVISEPKQPQKSRSISARDGRVELSATTYKIGAILRFDGKAYYVFPLADKTIRLFLHNEGKWITLTPGENGPFSDSGQLFDVTAKTIIDIRLQATSIT